MMPSSARSPGSVRPGGGSWARNCSLRPATRISKNSSRLLPTIARKRSRSSSGVAGSCASARTRRLNASCESSRLIGDGGVCCIDKAVPWRPAPKQGMLALGDDILYYSLVCREPAREGIRPRFLLPFPTPSIPVRVPNPSRAKPTPRRMRERKSDRLLAVVDLGSNSFRLEIGRVEGDQIYQLDTWRETLRFGAGVDDKGRLTRPAMKAALACLARFRERLSGLHPAAVRVVATNMFRVAKNAQEFVALAERTLGLPIDVISGHEEGRLTFFGVAHELPPSTRPRLVIDIGGGSTEFIIGRGFEPERLESLTIGCVGMTQRFFRDGAITAAALDAAETVARSEIEAIAGAFGPGAWHEAYGSSGHGGRARRYPRAKRFFGRRRHARRPRATAPAPAGSRPRHASQAQCAQGRARAGARRRATRSWRARSQSSASSASIRSAARCVSACSTISSAARSTRMHGPRPSSASSPATASTARRRFASAISRRRYTGAPWPRRMRRSRSSSNGRDACTKWGCRYRTTASTSTARTSCRTPTCRAFPPASRAAWRSSCSRAEVGSRRSPAISVGTAAPRGRARRAASRCSSITRAPPSRCRGYPSRSRAISGSASRGAGLPRIR